MKIPIKDESSVAFDKFVLEVYTGNFKDDLYHGLGRYNYFDGSYYDGNW